MNKKLLTLLSSTIAALALTSCGVTEAKEYDFAGLGYQDRDYIALKHVLVNMSVGEKKSLEIETFPTAYKSSSLTFTSLDSTVATVNAKGEVTGVQQGVTDVVVASKDEEYSAKIKVVVSKKSSKTGVSGALDAINAKYEDESHVAPTKVVRYEYSHERYYCEGVLDHGMDSYEAMGFNAETGYFFVEGPSVYYKTQKGAPEVMDGKWIFYPVNYGIKTRLIHITPKGKNFYDLNTANYSSYDRIIKDIMNFFFVSGEKIVNDLLEDYDGAEMLNDLIGYSQTKFYAVDDKSVYLQYGGTDDGYVVDADDELNYFDIPAGTEYSIKMNEEVLNYDALTLGLDVQNSMYYELNGKKWERQFHRSQYFDNEFEEYKVQDPKNNGYVEVDSLYDL